jgi:serine/threonine protein kinase
MDLKSVGKYTIVAKIGQGAMGEVYKALDPILNRNVAIKTMTAAIGEDPELRARFLREAQSAARLSHPNIVTLYDFGEDHGRVYMAMELLTGSDLKDLIKQKTLSLSDKLHLMEQVCDALSVAHAVDVVHRDLKPANIHVQTDNKVKIVDFGLARLGGSSDMTKTGMVMGTPHYMSPEQVRGDKADVRSDVFSLGAVFYELLANRKAFDADSLHAVFFQVLEHEPPPVSQLNAEVPEVLVPFLARAMAKKPDDRYQNATEMREALRVARRTMAGELAADSGSLEPGSVPPSPSGSGSWRPRVQGSVALAPEAATRVQSGTLPGAAVTATGGTLPPTRSSLPLVLGGGVALLLVAAGGFVWWQRSQGPPPTSGVELVTRQLVMTKMDLARTKLEIKDYRAAEQEADQVLELEPNNQGALEVKAEVAKVLRELDTAALEARQAVQAGQLDVAKKALARVMSLDSQHPVAAELSKELDSSFRDQVDEARQAMKRSQESAEGAQASTQKSYERARTSGSEAEALFGRGEFTMATQKFLSARDDFERARKSALERTAQASLSPALPPLRPSAAPSAVAPSAVPSGRPPTAPPSAAPSAVPTPAPQASATAIPAPADDQPVRRVIADYERAIETHDIGLYKRIWPTLSGAQEKALMNAFSNSAKQDVQIRLLGPVELNGTQAKVRLQRTDVVDGKPIKPFNQTVTLVRQGDSWTIKSIGQ